MVDKSVSIKFWDSVNPGWVTVFVTRRNYMKTVEFKLCIEYEDEHEIPVRERCITVYPTIDDLKMLKELIDKVIS